MLQEANKAFKDQAELHQPSDSTLSSCFTQSQIVHEWYPGEEGVGSFKGKLLNFKRQGQASVLAVSVSRHPLLSFL